MSPGKRRSKTMKTFELSRPRGFKLSAAADFYKGFTPGSGMAIADPDNLTLAFRLDRTFEPVVVGLREDGDRILADFAGTSDATAVRSQITRMLGLEVDG